MYLVGQSYVYLNGFSTFNFFNNTTTNLGGAIYYFEPPSIAFQPCLLYCTVQDSWLDYVHLWHIQSGFLLDK